MIISNHHKFIFAAIPKTGTHSVRRALRKHLGSEDHEQVGLFVKKELPYPELAQMQHGHLTLAQIRPYVGEAAFASYFKFAFVRNPFDRFISYCSFRTRDSNVFETDPKLVMRHMLANPPLEHILFSPQFFFVTDAGGKMLADDFGRVEDMQASYDRLSARIGVPTEPLERANSSRRGDYRGYYDQGLIDAVAALYRQDLELFGYSF